MVANRHDWEPGIEVTSTWLDEMETDIASVRMLPTPVKTANYTAVAGDLVPVNTTSGTITITLPSAPANGTIITVKQVAGANTVIVVRAGTDVFNFAAGATSLTLAGTGYGVILRYAATGGIWYSLDVFPISAVGSAYAPSAGPVPAAYAAANDRRFTAVDRTKYVADATLVIGDAGKVIDVDSAIAATLTVPPSTSVSWQDGTVMNPVALNDGVVSIAPGSGVTFIPPGTWKLRAKGSGAQLRKLPGGGAALPTSNLLLRYKADDVTGSNGAVVASWPESSGNGLPAATQATTGLQPTVLTNSLNGHRVVQFDGVNDFMSLTGSALAVAQNRAAIAWFIAYYYNSTITGVRTLLSVSNGLSSTSVRNVIYQRDSSALIGAGGRRLDVNTGVFLAGAASVVGSAEVATGIFDYTNSDLFVYRNGTLAGSNTSFQTAGSSENTVSLAGTIGANLAGTSEFANVRIAEILAYSTADSANRIAVHTYLQATYGVSMADSTSEGDVWHIQGDITA